MKLALGTVQFGVNYGISNVNGLPSQDEIRRILIAAEGIGVDLLDTAALYGASEQTLGNCMQPGSQFRIVTKTPQFKAGQMDRHHAAELVESFSASLEKLGRTSAYGLLIHQTDNLLAPGGEHLMDAMAELKAKGLVQKIGASVYTSEQIDKLLDRYTFDLIQLPVNVFDQRLVKQGQLSRLKQAGVEIHARSVFLQGLLLMQPSAMKPYFAPFQALAAEYQAFLVTLGLTPLQGALAYINSLQEIDYAVVGVTSQQEFEEIVRAKQTLVDGSTDWSAFSCDNESMINPAVWQ